MAERVAPIDMLESFLGGGASSATDGIRHYALVDPAQDSTLPGKLRGVRDRCLLGDASAVSEVSPHLLEFPAATESAGAIKLLASERLCQSAVVLLSSPLDFDRLFAHLLRFLDVKINASKTMLLAWWDPAIMASLLGQPDDDTLYEKGPVFDSEQRHSFVAPLSGIGYWDRLGRFRKIDVGQLDDTVPASPPSRHHAVLPLQFSADQVRALVKAATPDQVLYELRLNQPGVLSGRDEWQNYAMTCGLVDAAHGHGVRGLQDLVNFTGTGMILGEGFHQFPQIADELASMQRDQRSFSEVMRALPPHTLQQAQEWVSAGGDRSD